MSDGRQEIRFAVLPLPAEDAHLNEFARTMVPHPLVHQELPYEPQYTIYNRRLTAIEMNTASAEDAYWRLRRHVILRHTGELPIEVRGPDAEKLLNLVFTRDVTRIAVGRCSYQFACNYEGGMIIDGVLVRLADDRFWYGQADGDLSPWLEAHARNMDVEIVDPEVWVSQVQGPDSLEVLAASVDGPYPDPFRYFDAAHVRIAGQRIVITRTGFTNELGWEFYLPPDVDAHAVGERILEAGKPYGMTPVAVGGARRIEAGLLNAGSDFDETVTPFAAGLGSMVNLNKADFIGKAALQDADKRRRTWGLRVPGGVARLGKGLSKDGAPAGRVCSTAWSPLQRCGVAIVRLDDPDLGPGTAIDVVCRDGENRPAQICGLPMYDEERQIPRGERVDIPDRPKLIEPP
jgi:glycine cleavage system aminomethyltransferase T